MTRNGWAVSPPVYYRFEGWAAETYDHSSDILIYHSWVTICYHCGEEDAKICIIICPHLKRACAVRACACAVQHRIELEPKYCLIYRNKTEPHLLLSCDLFNQIARHMYSWLVVCYMIDTPNHLTVKRPWFPSIFSNEIFMYFQAGSRLHQSCFSSALVLRAISVKLNMSQKVIKSGAGREKPHKMKTIQRKLSKQGAAVILLGNSTIKNMVKFAPNDFTFFPASKVLNTGIPGDTVKTILSGCSTCLFLQLLLAFLLSVEPKIFLLTHQPPSLQL